MKRNDNKNSKGAAPYLSPVCSCSTVRWSKHFCQSTGTETLIEDNDDPWDLT